MAFKLKSSRSQLAFLPKFAEYGLIFYLVSIVTLFTAIFIFEYCHLFHVFGDLSKERLLHNPYSVFIITPSLFWFSAYLCRRFSPNSSGSSLEHIKASLHQLRKTPNSFNKISRFLNLRIAIVTAISSLASTFGGGALGREAPSLHMTTSIFVVIAHKMRFISKKISIENWIFAGSAAGFAIAFNAPIAGLFYVTEKMLRHKSKSFYSNLIWSFAALFVAMFILRDLEPLFASPAVFFEFNIEVIFIVFLAMICGVCALIFKETTVHFYKKFAAIKSNMWHLLPITAGLMVATVSLYAGLDSFSGGVKTIQDAMGTDQAFLGGKEVIGRIVNTFLTFIAGCAGGLVAPAVAIGAGIGSLVTYIIDNSNIHMFILTGMVAFLSPVLGLPFTAAAVILETSSQSLLIFPFLLFSSLISSSTAYFTDLLNRFYSLKYFKKNENSRRKVSQKKPSKTAKKS